MLEKLHASIVDGRSIKLGVEELILHEETIIRLLDFIASVTTRHS